MQRERRSSQAAGRKDAEQKIATELRQKAIEKAQKRLLLRRRAARKGNWLRGITVECDERKVRRRAKERLQVLRLQAAHINRKAA
jgi:hypothetical protein